MIFVFTHDSIAVGEDGPTHQPIEQLVSLRAIPKLVTIRPADANETADAWRVAMTPTAPACSSSRGRTCRSSIALAPGHGRQALTSSPDSEGDPDIVLIGTGSEVDLAVARRRSLGDRACAPASSACPRGNYSSGRTRHTARACSARPGRLASRSRRGSPSAGSATSANGAIVGIDRFGASGPGGEVLKHSASPRACHCYRAARPRPG